MDVASFIQTVDAFRSLSPESARRLAERVDVHDYASGEMIIQRGGPGDSMMIIMSGNVQVPITDEHGRKSFIAQLGERQFFGETALLTGEPRNADVIAASDCRCVVIPKSAVDELVKQYPEIGRFLTEILGERLMSIGGIRKVGKYNLIGELGSGGMAVVYEGVHPTLGRPVAIKMLSHELVYHEHFAARFRNEAKIIAGLRHPNIVEVFDTEEAYATFFIVMEKLVGKDLDRVLEHRGRLGYDEVRDIIIQVASALDYAHKKGVFHRDVKPSNIVLEPDNKVKLMDFGLALVQSMEKDLNVRKGVSLGTPTYMAPEQAMAKPMDGRADIYALGIVAFEMLTGQPPFPSDDPYTVMKQHVNEPIPSIRRVDANVPKDIEEFIARATKKNPNDRFQSCSEIIDFFSKNNATAFDPDNVVIRTVTFVFAPEREAEVTAIIDEIQRHTEAMRNLIVKT